MTLRRPLTLINGLLRLLPPGDRLPGSDIGARVTKTSNQLIPNDLFTAISFSNVRYGPSGIWSTLNPSRLTCTAAGKYLIGGTIIFAGGTAGSRQMAIMLNGNTFIARDISSFSTGTCVLSTVYNLAVNDYVELMAYQNNGSALNVLAESAYSPEFWIHLLP